jgi:hypothetical protein
MACGTSKGVVAVATLTAFAVGLSVACGGGQTADVADASSPTRDGGGVDAAPDATRPDDAGAPGDDCGPPSALPEYASPAGGTIEGTGLQGSVCNAAAYVFLSHYTTPPGDYLLFINSTQTSTFSLSVPGASDGLLDVTVLVGGPMPGTYASSGTSTCGFLGFSYSLPVPPGVDCDGGVAPDCPPGCASVCSGQGCEPCTPQQPEVGYGATAASDCLGETQAVAGSWSATITSVGSPVVEQGGTYYAVHGTFAATLVDEGDAGAASVNVSLTF